MEKGFGFFLILIVLLSCSKTDFRKEEIQKPMTILVQPFDDMKEEQVNFITRKIQEIYPHIKVLDRKPIFKEAFYEPRNRYRADTIIRKLSVDTEKGFVTLGLTNKDISVSKGKTIKDFGVMGLGYRPGKACVASSFRLNPKKKLEQHFKIAIHEIGHTQGLPHCPNKTCFMRDAEGGNPTDELVDFCPKCKTFLNSKNWKFN